jgi:CubicO group peptidase (beta-lactamase class C family)
MRLPPPTLDLGDVARVVVDELVAAPCACVAGARREGALEVRGFGSAGRLDDRPGSAAALGTTPFDLASVTKPITALTLARLVRAGTLRLEQPLGDVVPELAETASGRVPLELLVSHRAGLDGHRPLYAPLLDGHSVDVPLSLVTAANARRAECVGEAPPEGFAPIYSDLGYLLLGRALEVASGLPLDVLMAREVTGPLGLDLGSARQWRAKRPHFTGEVAPTEDVAFRGGVVRGVVHDENAWALVGDGCAGHAGLFGDASSVLALGLALLDALADRVPEWLSPRELEPLLRERPGGSLLAGFDRRSGPAPSSGSRFGARTFGHLGFTGTSLWIDPDAQVVGVLLTNRVHPTRAADAIRRARPRAYDALFERLINAPLGGGKGAQP